MIIYLLLLGFIYYAFGIPGLVIAVILLVLISIGV